VIEGKRIAVVSREGIDHEARSDTGAEWLMNPWREFPELQRGELSREGIEPDPATSRN
jgi:hypothetical protein